ncbi:MAG: permease-like cell division protein FtsX [Gammaproteobacteria bacterium]
MTNETKKIKHKHKKKKKSFLHNYLGKHWRALWISFSRLIKTPLASFLTITVIAIALVMPITLYLLLQNLQSLTHGFNDKAQISLYLKDSVSYNHAQTIIQKIKSNPAITSVSYISPEEGLQEFQKESGFGDIIAQLNTNPLPAVLLIHPAITSQTPAAMQHLLENLKQLPEVESVQLDMEWVNRLFALLDLGKQTVLILGILLGTAMILIIGNTIKLLIENHRHEIEVIKLVGATNHFIRRPFLYSGMLYGLLGGLFAYGLTYILVYALRDAVANLAKSYQSHFFLQSLDLDATILLFVLSGILGWIGSWLAVARQLSKIQPE